MTRETAGDRARPTEDVVLLLKLMRAESAVLVRARGDEGPFRVIGSKSGMVVNAGRHGPEFVRGLVSDGWVSCKMTRLVESYGPSKYAVEMLKTHKTEVRRSTLKRGHTSLLRDFARGQGQRAVRAPSFDADSIKAWRRFQEDYEVACIEDPRFNDWDSVLDKHNHNTWGPFDGPTDDGTRAARLRSAVLYLGPDLATVMLRFFCLQEGMKEMEKRLNWPARSGKVVIAIAARRLADYYA